MKYHPLRIAVRLTLFLGIVFGSLLEACLRRGRVDAYGARTAWLQRWSRRTLRVLHVHCHQCGQPPDSGLVVSNHLGYLDVIVLAAQRPMVFVAKQEVRGWPLIGWCVRCAGTLFVNRERRADVKRVTDQFAPVLRSGAVLALFPEGTSSDGRQVLPFHSSLLAPAENQDWPVTPAWIGYHTDEGSVAEDIAYWGDMVFAAHLLRLLSRREIHAYVAWGTPLPGHIDRKEMARQAHDRIEALQRELTANPALRAPLPSERASR